MYVRHVGNTRNVQGWSGTCSALLLYSRILEPNKGMLFLVWRVVYDAGSSAGWASGRTCAEWYSTARAVVRSRINSAIASSGLNSEKIRSDGSTRSFCTRDNVKGLKRNISVVLLFHTSEFCWKMFFHLLNDVILSLPRQILWFVLVLYKPKDLLALEEITTLKNIDVLYYIL